MNKFYLPLCRFVDQYLSYFCDFCVILKLSNGAFEWYKNHKNPIRIDQQEGKIVNKIYSPYQIKFIRNLE